MSAWGWSILISAVVDFIIVGGSCLTGYMVAYQTMTMPTPAILVFAVITGLIGAAKDVQSKISGPRPPAP